MSVAGCNEGDWLSNTIRMVDTQMVRHGFQHDVLQTARQTKPSRQWIKSLAAALRLQTGAQNSGSDCIVTNNRAEAGERWQLIVQTGL